MNEVRVSPYPLWWAGGNRSTGPLAEGRLYLLRREWRVVTSTGLRSHAQALTSQTLKAPRCSAGFLSQPAASYYQKAHYASSPTSLCSETCTSSVQDGNRRCSVPPLPRQLHDEVLPLRFAEARRNGDPRSSPLSTNTSSEPDSAMMKDMEGKRGQEHPQKQ